MSEKLRHRALAHLVTFLGYTLLARLALGWAMPPGFASPVWPAAGLAVAAVIYLGHSACVPIFLGSLAANILGGTTPDALTAVPVGLGAALQASAVRLLLARFRLLENPFRSPAHSGLWLLSVGPLASLVSASTGVLWLSFQGISPPGGMGLQWLSWWGGDVLGAVLVGPALLLVLGAWSPTGRRDRSLALGVLTATSAVLILTAHLAQERSREQLEHRFHLDAQDLIDRTTQSATSAFSAVQSVQHLIETSDGSPDAHRFARFARLTLRDQRDLRAISWNPRVSEDERAALEAELRDAAGQSAGITERAPGGALIPAGPRAHYTVVRIITPLTGNEAAVGYDVSSEPVRRAALEQAARTGSLAVTGRLDLVQDTHSTAGVLAFGPVFGATERNGQLRGFVTGVFDLGQMMGAMDRSQPGLLLRASDDSAPRATRALYASEGFDEARSTVGGGALARRERYELGGRTWAFEVVPTSAYIAENTPVTPLLVLLASLTIAILITLLVLTVSTRSAQLEQGVAERTRELETAQKHLERAAEARLELDRQLLHSQRLEAVGTLASGVAHDFNNVLGTILLLAEEIQASVSPGSVPHRAAATIRTTVLRARDVTRRIRVFSRKSVLDAEQVDLASEVEEAIGLLRAAAPSSVEIEAEVAPVGAVELRPGDLQQVVINVGTNALHAMPEGGSLRITLERAREIAVPGSSEDRDYACLTFRDTGTGMSAEVRARAMDPYFTTKGVGVGTGLGLSVVHGIVKTAGGSLTVASTAGVGTTIRIYLPVVVLGPPAVEEVPETQPGSEHLLLVDDEAPLLRAMARGLRHAGYRVTSCQSPQDALRRFEADPDDFDALMTDQDMPKMTGVSLARRVRAVRPDLPVLLWTGHGQAYGEAASQGEGAIDLVLSKPSRTAQITGALRTLLDARGRPATRSGTHRAVGSADDS